MRIGLQSLVFSIALCWVNAVAVNSGSLSELPYSEGIAPRDAFSMSAIILEGSVDSTYIIGPGDYFELMAENSSVTVQVSPEGSVSMEQVGVVNVGGVTLAEAKRRILSMLGKRYSASECYVKLAQIKRFRVGIYGALSNSGQQTIEPGQRLSLTLRYLGGVGPLANTDSILLIRHGDTTVLNLSQSEKGELSQDPILEQGDLVYIPEINMNAPMVYVRVLGLSKAIPWQQGATVYDYMSKCKTNKRNENQFSYISIENSDASKIQMLPLPQGYSFVPEPGMVIQPSMVGPEVFIGGATATIGHLDYDPTYHPQDYISKAGITPLTTGYGKVHVIHRDGTEEWLNPVSGIVLPGDYIDVPKSTYESVKDLTMFLATVFGVLGTYITLYITYKANTDWK